LKSTPKKSRPESHAQKVINEANNQQIKISESALKLIWKKPGDVLSKNNEKQMQVTFSQIRAISSIRLANR
jgi:hypothetical protein